MSTENQLQQPVRLLSELINWTTDLNSMAELNEQEEDLKEVFQNFFASHAADDHQLRNSVMVLSDHIKKLYSILMAFEEEDIRQLDVFNLELLSDLEIVS